MVTRVLDSAGRVLHDCADAGCSTSWDGYARFAFSSTDANGVTAARAQGEALPGRRNPNPAVWSVNGTTATLVGTP